MVCLIFPTIYLDFSIFVHGAGRHGWKVELSFTSGGRGGGGVGREGGGGVGRGGGGGGEGRGGGGGWFGGEGSKLNCFLCGEPGHFAQECPGGDSGRRRSRSPPRRINSPRQRSLSPRRRSYSKSPPDHERDSHEGVKHANGLGSISLP